MYHENELIVAGKGLVEGQATVEHLVKAVVVPLLVPQLSVMRMVAV